MLPSINHQFESVFVEQLQQLKYRLLDKKLKEREPVLHATKLFGTKRPSFECLASLIYREMQEPRNRHDYIKDARAAMERINKVKDQTQT